MKILTIKKEQYIKFVLFLTFYFACFKGNRIYVGGMQNQELNEFNRESNEFNQDLNEFNRKLK